MRRYPFFVLTVLACTCAVSGAVPTATLCFIVRPSDATTESLLVSRFTAEYYRAIYTNYNWSVVPLANGNANPTLRDAVSATLAMGPTCDAVLGPGSSTYSIALSALIVQPWVDFAATSTTLSDKVSYPWFSRSIPTDAQIGGGLADVVYNVGWSHVNMLASNDVYGSSISQQFIASHITRNGVLGVSQTLSPNAGVAEVHAFFNLIEAAQNPVRIVAVGTASSNPLFGNVINATLSRGLDRRYVFLFSESACSGDAQWRALRGALCVTFAVNASMLARFSAAYSARDISGDVAMLASYGRTLSTPLYYAQNVFTAFAHDAVLAAMAGLNAVPNISVRSATLAAIRRVQAVGMTGALGFLSTGDRSGAQLSVLNVNDAGAEVVIGALQSSVLVPASNATSGGAVPRYWLASYYSADPPADTIASGFQLQAWMIALAAACVVVLLALVLAAVLAQRNAAALEHLLSLGFASRAGKALMLIAVFTIKLLVAVNLIIANADLGYLIPYVIVTGFGLMSFFAEMVLHVRYIVAAAMSEDGLSVDEELRDQLSTRRATVVTTVMSDVPSVVISCVVVSTTSGASEGLLLAMIVITSFFIGLKAAAVRDIVSAMLRAVRDEDEDAIDVEAIDPATADGPNLAKDNASDGTSSTPSGTHTPHEAAGLGRVLPMVPDQSTSSQLNPVGPVAPAVAAAIRRFTRQPTLVGNQRTKMLHLGRSTAVAWRSSGTSVAGIARYVIPEILRSFDIAVDVLHAAMEDDALGHGVSNRAGPSAFFVLPVITATHPAEPASQVRRAVSPGRPWSGMSNRTAAAAPPSHAGTASSENDLAETAIDLVHVADAE